MTEQPGREAPDPYAAAHPLPADALERLRELGARLREADRDHDHDQVDPR